MDEVEELRRRARARGWRPTDDEDTWTAGSPDGSERATVRVAGGAYEARVVRRQTGPSPGPDPEPSHGPQVFESCEDALDYAEANLGADGAPSA